MRTTLALAACAVLAAGSSLAQSPQSARIVGQQIGGHSEWHAATATTSDTRTLTFRDGAGGATYTIDFVVRYGGRRPTRAPQVVDMIVTQHAVDEVEPAMTLQVDGEPLPLVSRARSARSIVASLPFDDFVRLTNAGTIVQRAFGVDLELGAGQLRMLHTIAERWAGR